MADGELIKNENFYAMKGIFLTLFTLCLAVAIQAQDLFENKNNIFHNENGKEISATTAKDMLYGSSQKFELRRSDGGNGKTIIRLVPISEKAYWKSINADKKKVKKLKGSQMFDFSLKDMNGKTYSKSDYDSKLTVYNFWFTGCRPCLVEMPQLNELVDKYGDRVNFVAPTFEPPSTVEPFLKKKIFKYQILVNGADLAKQMNITSYPTHLIVDAKGKIVDVIQYGSETIGNTIDKIISANLD